MIHQVDGAGWLRCVAQQTLAGSVQAPCYLRINAASKNCAASHHFSGEVDFSRRVTTPRGWGLLIKIPLIFLTSLVAARSRIWPRRTPSASVPRKMNIVQHRCTSVYTARPIRAKNNADSLCLRAHTAVDVCQCLEVQFLASSPVASLLLH